MDDKNTDVLARTLPGKASVNDLTLPTEGAMQGTTTSPNFSDVREMLAKARKPFRPNRAKPKLQGD